MLFSSRAPWSALAVSLLVIAGCGDAEPAPASPATTPATEPSTESMDDSMAESMDDSMTESMAESMDDSMHESMAESMDDSMVQLAAWQQLAITDVDGETFTIAEYVGTPVVVELFATWCPKCRQQLADTNAAAAELDGEAVVLALSVETDLDPADVAEYAASNGFDSIRFAVLSPEQLAAMVDTFGPTASNPPSTPKFVIDAMGHVGELTTGSESVEQLVAAVRASG